MTPKISIIIPVYNTAPYLPGLLDSVLAQTLSDIEIVCVDDGSRDESGEILDEYAARDARLRVIHKQNGGVSAARRDGINAATGEYIGFVDSDDFIEPEMYAQLLGNMEKQTADISCCGHQVHQPNGAVTMVNGTGEFAMYNRAGALETLLTGRIEPGLCNKLFRRDFVTRLMQSGKMDESIRINEDLLMNFYLFRMAEKVVYEDICPYHYLKREGSASRSRAKHVIWDQLRVKQIISADCRGTEYETMAQRALLSTCQHVYHDLLASDGEKAELAEVRGIIAENRRYIDLLGKKQKWILRLILHTPGLYGRFYRGTRKKR